ncbi:MobA/MobL family protein [Bradyrhizobium sp. CCBAU 21359]|uniref:MobA/MobL family protein n=1 Tax=Bradyrhizobium sp. CCBAU 21359 TaxID=1325080 RepID=UPI0023060A9B|nr:MobA/MobL family protein [Bradyrhizobium sp. CCBAU 21359]
MASYHFSVQPVKRSDGRFVLALTTYRAGERLRDERRWIDVDFSRRRGVVHAEVLHPRTQPNGCLIARRFGMAWSGKAP